ncbi:MAG: multicomponent Na+:H+ antiporter subunit F [Motiliproteus sp.]|jgi:multicomponent Na+:H+ antiporter subunit F
MTGIETLPLVALIIVMLALCIGLLPAVRGSTLADRMLSVQLLGTGGVAVLLLLAGLSDSEALVDVALVLALLVVVAVAALTSEGTKHG